MATSLSVDLEKLSKLVNLSLPASIVLFFLGGNIISFYFHFLTVGAIMLTAINFYYLFVQRSHTLLSNFGLMAQARYLLESIGPELRQYLFASDTEETPFSRVERAEVYRKAKNVDSSEAFGSQTEYDRSEFKLIHSMYPKSAKEVTPYELVMGNERGLDNSYTLSNHIMISAMSYGALGKRAIRSLSRGANQAGILMNTGEGGYPKYHLMEGADLIFQIGTAKFGVRNEDGNFDPIKLEKIANLDNTKMIELKLSQGAKPGKGGLLPKEKISEEVAELRGVAMGKDIESPPGHKECTDSRSTVGFIRELQEITKLPVGIKLCFGDEKQFADLLREMKLQNCFPDYISIDGGEGGTGAAPASFLDSVGPPLFYSLPRVNQICLDLGVRSQFKVFAAGRLISPASQTMALCLGADACYTARGFMLALGCIQALQCQRNTCPTGITSHKPHLEKGLDIEDKAVRVAHYARNLNYDVKQLVAALGHSNYDQLNSRNVLFPASYSREALM